MEYLKPRTKTQKETDVKTLKGDFTDSILSGLSWVSCNYDVVLSLYFSHRLRLNLVFRIRTNI